MNDQSVAGLSVILGQMAAYFRNRVNVDDLDVLNFSLHHLFCRIDYLYLTALPELLSSILAVTEQALSDDLASRQNIWSKLRDIKHIINRLEPLCNLLVDATRCILEAFDSTGHMAGVPRRSPATTILRVNRLAKPVHGSSRACLWGRLTLLPYFSWC